MMLSRRSRRTRAVAIAGAAVALAGGGSTLAIAAGDDPAPPEPKPLERAAADALQAKAPAGVSARFEVTSRLPGGLAAAAGPARSFLSGATGHVWAADGHLRADVRGRNGDRMQVVARGRQFWAYQSRDKRVIRGRLPAATGGTAARRPGPAAIQRLIGLVRSQATLSRAVPGVVAGRPAYTVRVTPRRARGMAFGKLSWDAEHGVPLRASLYAAGSDAPLVDVEASDVSLGTVPDSVWDVHPPAGARVTTLPRHP